jgi:peptidoglycan hydrolase-like protein with peptidoglycan-binding domain
MAAVPPLPDTLSSPFDLYATVPQPIFGSDGPELFGDEPSPYVLPFPLPNIPPAGGTYNGEICLPTDADTTVTDDAPPTTVTTVPPPPQPALPPPAKTTGVSPALQGAWELSRTQKQMAAMGYDVEQNGAMGPKTRAAIIQLQHAHGLPETGKMNPATKAAFESDVTRVQQHLVDAGYNPHGVDGRYGSDTTAAIRQYQLDHDITPADGKMNVPTWEALFAIDDAETDAGADADSVDTNAEDDAA